jgi:hypothetical protein
MASRSKISRIMEFFRSGDKDEVRAVAIMAAEVLGQRGILVQSVGQVTAASGPVVKTRKRKSDTAPAASVRDGADSTDAGKEQ